MSGQHLAGPPSGDVPGITERVRRGARIWQASLALVTLGDLLLGWAAVQTPGALPRPAVLVLATSVIGYALVGWQFRRYHQLVLATTPC